MQVVLRVSDIGLVIGLLQNALTRCALHLQV